MCFCLTISTSYIIKLPSFEPVASLVPSGENLQNHTSSVCSVSVRIVTQGNVCLEKQSIELFSQLISTYLVQA